MLQGSKRFRHVFSKAVGICGWVSRLIEPAVNPAAEMLDESGIDTGIDAGDRFVEIRVNDGLTHKLSFYLLKSALRSCPIRLATAR